MGENGQENPNGESKTFSRRAFLKLAAATTAVVALDLRRSAPEPTIKVAEEQAKSLQDIIKPPTERELANIRTSLESECKESFTSEKRVYEKEYRGSRFEFTVITSKTEDNSESSAVMVRKMKDKKIGEQTGDVVLYNHSIEGANFDVDVFYSDFDEIWNNDGVVIFPLMQGFMHDLPSKFGKADDFFRVKDGDKDIDITNTKGWFSEFSPPQMLRPINALFEFEPDLKDKNVDVIGISLGASIGMGMVTMWNDFKNYHSLPNIQKTSLYAPINSMLDKQVLVDALQEGDKGHELGVHRIFRSFVQGSAYEFQQYLQKRFYVQAVPLPEGGNWKVYVQDRGDEERGYPKRDLYEFSGTKDSVLEKKEELHKQYNLRSQQGNQYDYDIGYSKSVSENLLAVKALGDDSIGVQMIRESLIRFSPEYMVQITDNKPNFPINIVYANADMIVPAEQSRQLVSTLEENNISVQSEALMIGGHYWGNPTILHMPQYLRRK